MSAGHTPSPPSLREYPQGEGTLGMRAVHIVVLTVLCSIIALLLAGPGGVGKAAAPVSPLPPPASASGGPDGLPGTSSVTRRLSAPAPLEDLLDRIARRPSPRSDRSLGRRLTGRLAAAGLDDDLRRQLARVSTSSWRTVRRGPGWVVLEGEAAGAARGEEPVRLRCRIVSDAPAESPSISGSSLRTRALQRAAGDEAQAAGFTRGTSWKLEHVRALPPRRGAGR